MLQTSYDVFPYFVHSADINCQQACLSL